MARLLVTHCFIYCALVSISGYTLTKPFIPEGEKEPSYWNNIAEQAIKDRLKQTINEDYAKNIILFVGDGMGISSVNAGRILRGQINNRPGEENYLKFEKFPNVALSKTYNVDRQTPDSAGTGTSIMSGVKCNFYQIGLDARAETSVCETSLDKRVTTILDWSKDAGMKTGVVTTARITHATPAATYAHAADRYWEGDVNTKDVVDKGCKDIARQLVEDNPDINVAFGGGRRYFLLNTTVDPETGKIDKNQRQDGRDLIKMWQDDKESRGFSHKYVWNKEGFDMIDPDYTDYALGLFEPNHMQYDIDRTKSGDKGEPSLAEMTRKAIKILQKDDKGFFLLVEAARIDHGHHDSLPVKALYDVLALEDAVEAAMDLTDEKDTLMIVTADHSVPFEIVGYQYRGSDLFGYVEPIDPTELTMDDKPYSVLMYSNGPGYKSPREHDTLEQLHDKDFTYPSAVPVPWTTHSGEDVAIYARGPMSHLFHGVQEMNYIAHVMAYSSCIGRYNGKCVRSGNYCPTSVGSRFQPPVILYVILSYFLYLFK